MKQKLCILITVVVIIIACQPQPKTVPVDTEAEKAAVSAMIDKFNAAILSKDVNATAALLADNSLSCGTDPSEFWDKKQIVDLWAQMFADTSLAFNYTMDSREIRVAADGNAAIIVEQGINLFISSKMVSRTVSHAVKTNGNWEIDFISWSLVPKNEDLPRINLALE